MLPDAAFRTVLDIESSEAPSAIEEVHPLHLH